MAFGRRTVPFLLVPLLLALTPSGILASGRAAKDKTSAQQPMDETKRALHALNRLTFGPRPGDLQQVTAMGADKWIELQLHPEKIADGGVEAHLAPFRT